MQYYNNTSGGRLANAPVTKNLLIINLIVFIATQLSPDFMMRNFALFYPTSHYFHWWQLVTHMFMHGASRTSSSICSPSLCSEHSWRGP